MTFNDHVGSTKSYEYAREHYHEAVQADYSPVRQEITASYAEGELLPVQMHDGSRILLRKLDPSYDPRNRGKAYTYLRDKQAQGEYLTGLIYIDETSPEFHEVNGTTASPVNQLGYEKLSPGKAGLAKIMSRYR